MIPNRKLFIPYVAPYFAYVFIASVFKNHISTEINYTFRLVLVSLLIIWAYKWYFPITGPKSTGFSCLSGVLAGILGFIVWILLLTPFVNKNNSIAWSNKAFLLRFVAAGFLVPFFEELFTRGFIFRLAYQWDISGKKHEKDSLADTLENKSVNDVAPGSWSWMAIIISTIVFVSGHHLNEWLAAVAFSALMVWLWITRKDLISCIVAHSVTNITLALYVYQTGKWYYW